MDVIYRSIYQHLNFMIYILVLRDYKTDPVAPDVAVLCVIVVVANARYDPNKVAFSPA